MAALKNQGGELVGSVSLSQPSWQREFRDLLTSRQPQGVYVCGYGPAIIHGLQELRSAGYQGTVATTSAINSATVLKEAGPLAEGVFFPLATVDITSKEEPIATFVRRFQEVYNLSPDIYAAHGYDAALSVMYATANLRTRAASEIQVRLKGLGETKGVTGHLAFDDFGNIKHYLRNFWIHQGRVEDFDAHVDRQKEEVLRRMRDILEGR
jgi:ABC-type branched-subunit amino acid transport system substrate-binding protein